MPAHHDYIPRPDGDFGAWAANFDVAVHDFWADQGLNPSDLKPFEEALLRWNAAYPAHNSAVAAARAAAADKRAARYGVDGVPPGTPTGEAGVEAEARALAALIQAMPATTDAGRAGLGITLRDEHRTRVPAPTSKPLLIVESAGRYTHELRLVDDASPTRRARPRGVERAELFVAFTPAATPPPPDLEAFRYLQSISSGGAVLSFDSTRGGMQAHYMARWVTRRGGIGPWSVTASATLAA